MFKNKIFRLVLIIISTIIIVVLFLKDEIAQVPGYISGSNPYWLVGGLASMVVFWVIEAKVFHLFMGVEKKLITFWGMFKLIISTQFFNAITPFSTGGQPFQIYILTRHHNMRGGRVSSASVQNLVSYQVALVSYGVIAIIMQFLHSDLIFSSVSNSLIFIGFSLNTLVVIILISLSNSKKAIHFISSMALRILVKLRFIKNKDKAKEKLLKYLKDFSEHTEHLWENKGLFIYSVFLHMLKLSAFYAVTYFISKALGLSGITLAKALLVGAYTMMFTSLIPIPGAGVGAEFGFLAFFGPVIVGPKAVAIMFIWRIMTFYIGLIAGFLTYNFGYEEHSLDIKAQIPNE